MIPNSALPTRELDETMQIGYEPTWAIRAMLLWKHRRKLALVTGISLAGKSRHLLFHPQGIQVHHKHHAAG